MGRGSGLDKSVELKRAQVWRFRDQLLETTHEVMKLSEGPRVVQQESLLGLLAEAIRPSGESGGSGGASAGPGLPLDAAALDLHQAICDEVTHQQWLARDAGKGEPGEATLDSHLRFWVDSLGDDGERISQAHALLSGWVHDIENLLDPPISVVLRRPCPACLVEYRVEDRDGEQVVNRVLVATIPRGEKPAVVINCRGCGGQWKGQDIHDLEQLTRDREPTK